MADVPQPPGAPRSGKPSTGEVTCPACGTASLATKTFCGHCGARLTRPCPSCGAENPPGNTFCGECGARLGVAASQHGARAGASAGTSSAVPAGEHQDERRLVTALFADLVGFTPLSERLDPEEVRAIQERYFSQMRAEIARYGGTVEKYAGDAVLALFGAPTGRCRTGGALRPGDAGSPATGGHGGSRALGGGAAVAGGGEHWRGGQRHLGGGWSAGLRRLGRRRQHCRPVADGGRAGDGAGGRADEAAG
jgi:hypothetical protein